MVRNQNIKGCKEGLEHKKWQASHFIHPKLTLEMDSFLSLVPVALHIFCQKKKKTSVGFSLQIYQKSREKMVCGVESSS